MDAARERNVHARASCAREELVADCWHDQNEDYSAGEELFSKLQAQARLQRGPEKTTRKACKGGVMLKRHPCAKKCTYVMLMTLHTYVALLNG